MSTNKHIIFQGENEVVGFHRGATIYPSTIPQKYYCGDCQKISVLVSKQKYCECPFCSGVAKVVL